MQPVYKHENGFDAVSTCHLGVATTAAAPTTTDYYYYNAYDETGAAAPGAAEYFEADGDAQYGKTKKKAGKNSKKILLGFFRSKTLKNVILRFEGFDLKNP